MSRLKKILLINWRDPGHPEAGGAEDYLFEVFRRLAAAGHQITWVASGFGQAPRETEIEGIRVIRLSGPGILFPWRFFRFYRQKLSRENFDLVIDTISKMPLLTPLYVRKPRLGIFFQFHGPVLFRELFWPVAAASYLFEILTILFYRGCRLVTISESTRDDLKKLGFSENKIRIIPPALDNKKYSFDPAGKNSWPSAVYLGRLKKYKGLADLLKAWAVVVKSYPSARLEIIGRGNDLPRLKKISRRLGLAASVNFLGFVSEGQKIEMLRRSWLMVYPSIKEGYGIAILEANACGVPVIGYRVSGVQDAVVDGKTGCLVPRGDFSRLAATILELLNNDRRREKMNRAAREFSQKFNWDDTAREFESLMGEL